MAEKKRKRKVKRKELGVVPKLTDKQRAQADIRRHKYGVKHYFDEY